MPFIAFPGDFTAFPREFRNGDYTLDYNFQSPWFGIFSSNHAQLSASYLTTVFEQLPAAAAEAQSFLRAHRTNVTCPATALKFQQHISAFGGGNLNTQVPL